MTDCGKSYHENADDSSKTISKYYYRMYQKARNIAQMGGYTPDGKRITCKNLYATYSRKGAKKGPGNFLTYVDRAAAEYGPNEQIKRDTRKHMQKIRRALNEHKK